MVTMRINLNPINPAPSPSSVKLDRLVANFIQEWHNEDNLQEVLNMALVANHIPAQVIKLGGPQDTLNFEVEPYPYDKGRSSGRKIIPGFTK